MAQNTQFATMDWQKSRQIDTSLPSNFSQRNRITGIRLFPSLVKVQFFFYRGINLLLPIHRTVKLANLQEPRNEAADATSIGVKSRVKW